ncbi:MAG: hypothetical protein H0X69_16205, partial [Gemmatimonadales bacterium]|nr:hypothetical protein [Gemmatimonadales bacterium]
RHPYHHLLGQAGADLAELLVPAHDLEVGCLAFTGQNDITAAPGYERDEEESGRNGKATAQLHLWI